MGATAAEFNHGAALRGMNTARSLGSDACLKGEGGNEISFRQLRFNDGRPDDGDGFVRKNNCAFGNGKHVARETQVRQIFKKAYRSVAEVRQGAKIIDLLGSESQV